MASGGADIPLLEDRPDPDHDELEDEEEDIEIQLKNEDVGEFPRIIPGCSFWFVALVTILFVGIGLCATVFAPQLAKLTGSDEKNFGINVIKYASIPIVMVPFTYAHIWLALWMTFFPTKFRGCCHIPGTNMGFPIGWQGIVPFKAVKMATMAVDMLTTKLLKVQEVIERLDPDVLAEYLQPSLGFEMRRVIEEIALDEFPTLWTVLPSSVKQGIVQVAQKDSKTAVSKIFTELQKDIELGLDIKHLVIEKLCGDLDMANEIFVKCSYKELMFIRNAGAWMGGFFGTIQMVIWIYYPYEWVLPVIGFVVGAATNWVALFVIFNPVNPIRCFCGRLTIQGLFLTRQREVSRMYGHMVGKNVLTARNLIHALVHGPRSSYLRGLADRYVGEAFDDALGVIRPGIEKAFGDTKYNQLRNRFIESIGDSLYDVLLAGENYMEDACDLTNTLRVRMSKLPFHDFERLIHPIFEEEEWKLVIMGGVLGVVIALVQAYALF